MRASGSSMSISTETVTGKIWENGKVCVPFRSSLLVDSYFVLRYPIRLVLNGQASKEIECHLRALRALTREMGLKPEQLKKTFDVYNAVVRAKTDPFRKKARRPCLPSESLAHDDLALVSPVLPRHMVHDRLLQRRHHDAHTTLHHGWPRDRRRIALRLERGPSCPLDTHIRHPQKTKREFSVVFIVVVAAVVVGWRSCGMLWMRERVGRYGPPPRQRVSVKSDTFKLSSSLTQRPSLLETHCS